MTPFLLLLCFFRLNVGQSVNEYCARDPGTGLLSCGDPDSTVFVYNNSIIITAFGERNDTHFFLNIIVYGEHWFGFGFAQSGDSGCTLSSADGECTMSGVDALIVGDYGGTVNLDVLEWTLGDDENGFLHASQDAQLLSLNYQGSGDNFIYSGVIRRPYNPS